MYNVTITNRITDSDCRELADNLRVEEVMEVFAASARTPIEAIVQSVKYSDDKFLARQDGKVLCISGIYRQSSLSNVGCPWLLTSNHMKQNPRALLVHSKRAIDRWRGEFKMLFNYVDARYEQSLRWAKWAGFDIHDPEPFGPFGQPFHRIQIGNR